MSDFETRHYKRSTAPVRIATLVVVFFATFFMGMVGAVMRVATGAFYPLIFGLLTYFVGTPMLVQYGVEVDPIMAVLHTGAYLLTVKRPPVLMSLLSLILLLLIMLGGFGVGGVTFYMVNSAGLPDAATATNNLAVGDALALLFYFLLATGKYTFGAMSSLFSRDAYGSLMVRLFGNVAVGYALFFTIGTYGNFAHDFGLWAANGFHSTEIWWVVLLGPLLGAIAALLLYRFLIWTASSPEAKLERPNGGTIALTPVPYTIPLPGMEVECKLNRPRQPHEYADDHSISDDVELGDRQSNLPSNARRKVQGADGLFVLER